MVCGKTPPSAARCRREGADAYWIAARFSTVSRGSRSEGAAHRPGARKDPVGTFAIALKGTEGSTGARE